MSENYSFFNSKDHDRKYNAKHWADYFKPLFVNGVFNGGLQVTANNDMTVTINAGYAWIDGYAYHLDEAMTVDLETASGNMNRIDNICVRLDTANRWVKSNPITGSYYSGTATPTNPERTTTINELCIARINVAAGTTAITQAMITDTRADSNLCGWVCGTVDQIDFSQITAQFNTFFAQYQADITAEYANYLTNISSHETMAQTRYDSMDAEFTAYEAAQKADFEAWIATVKDILDGNVAGNLLLLIEQKMQKVTVQTVNGITSLVIEDGLQMALNGFTAKDTTFNTDGSIREVDKIGNTKVTTFPTATTIQEEFTLSGGDVYIKTSTIGSTSITERIVKTS